MTTKLGASGKYTAANSLRSGFGTQPLSTKDSQPVIGFGSSVRDAASKQYLSADHAKVMGGNNSQGPIYQTPSAIGVQHESTVETAPMSSFGTEARLPKPANRTAPGPGAYTLRSTVYGPQLLSGTATAAKAPFGSSTRDHAVKVYQEDADKAYYGLGSPGPCTYKVYSMHGRQLESTKDSSGVTKIGKSQRFDYAEMKRAAETPGAGQYRLRGAVGTQSVSTKKTMPTPRIGTSTRDGAKKQFISTDHEKAQYGENSPGPVTAHMTSSMGRQTLSRKSSRPSYGFGTAKRDTIQVTNTPGPGTYRA